MKKIIIAAAIVCAATFANAASVGWGCAGLANYKGDAYDVFVIGQNGVTSIQQITALLDNGSSVGDFAFGSGTVANTGMATTAASTSGLKLDAGKSYEAFFVIFDNADAGKAENYLAITSAQNSTLVQSPAGTAASFTFQAGNQGTYANKAENWTKVSGSGVPEPTSGLLLALGLAGLALRRKQK